jgi:hypothetical protein
MEAIGNTKANQIFEQEVPPDLTKPTPTTDRFFSLEFSYFNDIFQGRQGKNGLE